MTSAWKTLLAAALLMLSAAPLAAQDYPAQDLHFVTGFPPGSGADVLTRYFAEKLRPLANRPVIVDNKVGASGAIALKSVALAKPDGYTMYLGAGSATGAQTHLYKVPPVTIDMFQIAATLNRQTFMIVVDAKSPHQTLPQLTQAMLKKGKDASYASGPPSSIVLGEMYKSLTGVQAVEVRYKDAAFALNDLLSGRLDYAASDPVFALSQQREGRLRILAQASGERLQAISDIPTMKESGVNMDLINWWAVHVPAATPRPVVDKLNGWINQILATPETKEFLNKFGGDPFISTPDAAQALFIKEEKNWGEYVRIAKIEPQS